MIHNFNEITMNLNIEDISKTPNIPKNPIAPTPFLKRLLKGSLLDSTLLCEYNYIHIATLITIT